ncbi:hypothetical protein Hanom_Chr04g00284091 [Helianthus anomalus]
MDLHYRDYPSSNRGYHINHQCNFQKLGTKPVTLAKHRNYLCILLKNLFI